MLSMNSLMFIKMLYYFVNRYLISDEAGNVSLDDLKNAIQDCYNKEYDHNTMYIDNLRQRQRAEASNKNTALFTREIKQAITDIEIINRETKLVFKHYNTNSNMFIFHDPRDKHLTFTFEELKSLAEHVRNHA